VHFLNGATHLWEYFRIDCQWMLNMFVKELKMYDYLKNEIKGVSQEIFAGQIKKWNAKTI
jgi:hypothetical protein